MSWYLNKFEGEKMLLVGPFETKEEAEKQKQDDYDTLEMREEVIDILVNHGGASLTPPKE